MKYIVGFDVGGTKCAEKLGMTISILCDIIDPEAVVIGGIFMRSDDLLADGILETMKREALVPCKVLKAGLGEKVGDYAALLLPRAIIKKGAAKWKIYLKDTQPCTCGS